MIEKGTKIDKGKLSATFLNYSCILFGVMYETLHSASGMKSDNYVIPSLRSRTSLSHVDNVAKNLRVLQVVTVFMKRCT